MSKVDYKATIEALESAAGKGTQKALAESLGVTPRTVQRYKSGEINVQGEVRQKIYRRARYHGVRKYKEEDEPPPGDNVRGTAVYKADEGDTDTPLKVTAQGFRVEGYGGKVGPYEGSDLRESHKDRCLELMHKALQKIGNTNIAEAYNVPTRGITQIDETHPNVSLEASRTHLPIGLEGYNVTIVERGTTHEYNQNELESW